MIRGKESVPEESIGQFELEDLTKLQTFFVFPEQVCNSFRLKTLLQEETMEKLIITAAVVGGITLPTQTQYLPITPQQIADEAVRAAQAGAACVHIYARNPKDGSPTTELDVYGAPRAKPVVPPWNTRLRL